MDTITLTGTFTNGVVSLSSQTIARVKRSAISAGVRPDYAELFLSKLSKNLVMQGWIKQQGNGKAVIYLTIEDGMLSVSSAISHTSQN